MGDFATGGGASNSGDSRDEGEDWGKEYKWVICSDPQAVRELMSIKQ